MKPFNKIPGTLQRGQVESRLGPDGKLSVSLLNGEGKVNVPYLPGYFGEQGHFIGGSPQPGTPVTVQQAEGGEYFLINQIVKSNLYQSLNISGNSLLIQSDSGTKINLDPDQYISIGNDYTQLRIDPNRNILSSNINEKFSVSEASINIEGIVKRDLNPRDTESNVSRRESHEYDDSLVPICFDPSTPFDALTIDQNDQNSSSIARNLPFIEKREMVYEFAHSFGYESDPAEASRYTRNKINTTPLKYNRREARTDLLGLTLAAPNYLMETVKGTVVDIYGNLLDLNRNVIPAGKEKNYSFRTNNDKLNAFQRIRAIERKSLAYHFEINARKGPVKKLKDGKLQIDPIAVVPVPEVNNKDDFARLRSRFFIDIDKEGQFKINVPASSETGNIPLLTRYENRSTVNGKDTPNNFSFDNQTPENKGLRRDIAIETFAFGSGAIEIKDPANTSALFTPQDRFTDKTILHGTAYHDITSCFTAFSTPEPFAYELDPKQSGIENKKFPKSFVSKEINISGPDANAGGRSGSINFDGMIEMNIGSNTVDKQSFWLDTHGSIIGNVGRDLNNVSMGLSLSGDLLIQVGGCDSGAIGLCDGQTKDSRFQLKNMAWRPGAVDIRVFRDTGEVTVVRIDNDGVTVMSPQNIKLISSRTLLLKAMKIDLDAEEINMYSNDPDASRTVLRNSKSIM